MQNTKIILHNIDELRIKLERESLKTTITFTESDLIIVTFDILIGVVKTLRYTLEDLTERPAQIYFFVMTAINENRERYKRSEQWQRKNPLH